MRSRAHDRCRRSSKQAVARESRRLSSQQSDGLEEMLVEFQRTTFFVYDQNWPRGFVKSAVMKQSRFMTQTRFFSSTNTNLRVLFLGCFDLNRELILALRELVELEVCESELKSSASENYDIVIFDTDTLGEHLAHAVDFARNSTAKKTNILVGIGHGDSAFSLSERFSERSDEFAIKPVNATELVLRLKAKIRRRDSESVSLEPTRIYNIKILPNSREIVSRLENGETTTAYFTNCEFKVIECLLNSQRRYVTRDEIALLMGYDLRAIRTIDVYVSSIRKKLGVNRDSLRSLRGKGYGFFFEEEPLIVAG